MTLQLTVEGLPKPVTIDEVDRDLLGHEWKFEKSELDIYARIDRKKVRLGRLIVAREQGCRYDEVAGRLRFLVDNHTFTRKGLAAGKGLLSDDNSSREWQYVYSNKSHYSAQLPRKIYLGCFACDIDAAAAVNAHFKALGLPPPNAIPQEFQDDLNAIAGGNRDPQVLVAALNRRLERTVVALPRWTNEFTIDLGRLQLRLRSTRHDNRAKVCDVRLELIIIDDKEERRSGLLDGYKIQLLRDGGLYAQSIMSVELTEVFEKISFGRYTLIIVDEK
ncbi:MAG TPA: hypothetical protein VNG90_03340 [Candidatus Acidoferrum sp.]|nr:hypothetical protein [Candidatus Acidoferrum sp.]